MSQMVVFNELWLLSERDASARRLSFNRKNLLVGSNGTGKSRAVKHMVWALGCEPPKRLGPSFDADVVAALKVNVGSKMMTFVRQNRSRAAFNEAGQLLFATASGSKWNKFFSEVFDFPLKLQRRDDGGFDFAGPSYALLPFYIDQDGSWGIKWNTFFNLGQFPSWQQPVFYSFSGLKQASYVQSKLKHDEVAFNLRNAKIEGKLQDTAYQKVVSMLPAESTVLDEAVFAQQLQNLASETRGLKLAQEKVRRELLAVAQERQQRTAELNLALESERELVEDLAYLSKYNNEAQLVCPTCSHVHTTSFHAKKALAVDAQEMHEVVVKLQRDIATTRASELMLQKSLNEVTSRLRKLNEMMGERKGGQVLADVIAAKSRLTLKAAYEETRKDVTSRIDVLTEEKEEFAAELAKSTNKEREKNVRKFYKEGVVSFASKLNIHQSELGSRLTIGARPPGASGSYAPRAALAIHLSLIATHNKYGVGSSFPFIVDTPQQSGQDPDSLGRMLDTILNNAETGQCLVATESIPAEWMPPKDCTLICLNDKRKLLQPEEYRNGIAAVGEMVQKMREAVLAEIQDSPDSLLDIEHEDVIASDDDDEDDGE